MRLPAGKVTAQLKDKMKGQNNLKLNLELNFEFSSSSWSHLAAIV